MSDPPKQSGSRDKQESISSPVPAGRLSPVVLITTSTDPTQEHVASDSPEESSLLQKHETMSSHAPIELQVPSGALDTTPAVNTAEPGMSALLEKINPLHEHETMSSHAPTGPQVPSGALYAAPTAMQTLETGKQPPAQAAGPSLQKSNPSQTSSPLSDTTFTFPIMKLPPELRLMVFDQLFLDLTVRRQRSIMYHNEENLMQKHQANDFRPYSNLLLTCKELNREAKNHWEQYYLHQCCFYFWHVWKLHDFAIELEKLGKPYTEIKYVLRSRHEESDDIIKPFCVAGEVARIAEDETDTFMGSQPGAPPDYPFGFISHSVKRLYASEGTYEATDEIPVRTVVVTSNRSFVRSECSGLESCTLIMRHDVTDLSEGCYRINCYREMQGKFSGIFWSGYDAAVGYGIFRLWEVSDPCNDRCQCQEWDDPKSRLDCDPFNADAKTVRIELFQRWYDGITTDLKWLALGGKPWATEPADLLYDYGMADWFDDGA
jgi:hypothetical protein